MASLDTNRGAKRARECRAALGLDPQEPLPDLLTAVEELAGVPVVIAPLGEGVAGAFRRVDDFELLFVNGDQALSRQRFTLAHELGHVRCGHDVAVHYDTYETLAGKATSSAEVQANSFAGEFLVPAAGLKARVHDEPGLEHVVTLAAIYGTSPISMVFSLFRAGVASDAVRDRLRDAVNADEHGPLVEELGLAWPEDRMTQIARPYLSPAIADSALGAALRGEATVAQAASSAGISVGSLQPAVERLERRAAVV